MIHLPRLNRSFAIVLFVTALAAVIFVPPLSADIPDKYTNLLVLPKAISKDDLEKTMRSYSGALGVRCGFCHVRPEGKPQADFDWASDVKPEKQTARVMMAMTRLINTKELPKITTNDPDKVEVTCRTCHHGQERPFAIEDILTASYQKGGMDSLSVKYEALRKQYYGTDAYNFGEQMLPTLAERLGGEKDTQTALKIAQYNLKWYPDSGFAHMALGQAQAKAGNKDAAVEELNKAVSLDPRLKQFVQRMLDQLQAK